VCRACFRRTADLSLRKGSEEAEVEGMRVSLVVYGLLYVVVETVGHQLAVVSWPELTPLDVATALTDAALVLTVAIAVLVGTDVGARRWRRSMTAWAREQTLLTRWQEEAPIGVRSWRPDRLALPAGGSASPLRPSPAANPYAARSYVDSSGFDQPGTLL
jgi:hypothetical protein